MRAASDRGYTVFVTHCFPHIPAPKRGTKDEARMSLGSCSTVTILFQLDKYGTSQNKVPVPYS